ncbi:MAG: hypothetical protein QOD04_4604 [Pseudonocardiales bacterium]|nr:hypothetical protein [Pseudonocardiales bacterium]MDT7753748.1 hypothetical protein [Pseudonocardiales bacterium]
MSSTATETRTDRRRTRGRGIVRAAPLPYALSGALAVAAAASAAFSFFVPSVLTGVAVGNGNLRGTALVVLLIGVPTLVTAMIRTARGSTRWLVGWLGTLGYLLYQAVLFCFATPLNGLFLCYVGYLGLAVWSIVALVPAVDLHGFGSGVSAGMPARFVAGFALAIAALNAAAWLAAIVPALLQSRPESLMKGTGLLTNPVYVQDLAIWLPLLATAAAACWQRRPWGLLLTGAMLAMFTLEGICVATDQWFGSRADPFSPAASMTMVPAFAVVAVVTGTVLALYLHNIARGRDRDDVGVAQPADATGGTPIVEHRAP